MSSIRGHQTELKVFRAGADAQILNITRFEVTQDSTFSRSHYVGNPVSEGDQTQEGWSGSFDLEVKGSEVDTLIDALITQNLNGIGVDECYIIDSEKYEDGTMASFVYTDVQFKMSKTQPAGTEKVTKRLQFQSSLRTPL